MRIISDFKDYYDCLQAHDGDRTIIYLRTTAEDKTNKYPLPMMHFRRIRSGSRNGFFGVQEFCIGFCGKVYPVLDVSHEAIPDLKGRRLPNRQGLGMRTSTYCFSIEDVDAIFEKTSTKKEFKKYGTDKPGKRKFGKNSLRSEIAHFFEACAAEIDQHVELFTAYEAPIFLIEPYRYVRMGMGGRAHRLILHPRLGEFQFYRVLDVHAAYRELLTFMNNRAIPQKPIPVPSDRDMVDIKGFDPVWGFRKPPGEKKKRKNKDGKGKKA